MRAETQQQPRHKRSSRQIERPAPMGSSDLPDGGFLIVGSEVGKVLPLDRGSVGIAADLTRLLVHDLEGGAQYLVSGHESGQRLQQGGRVEGTDQRQADDHVVSASFRLDLIEQPHPLLGVRQRSGSIDGAAWNRRFGPPLLQPAHQQSPFFGGQIGPFPGPIAGLVRPHARSSTRETTSAGGAGYVASGSRTTLMQAGRPEPSAARTAGPSCSGRSTCQPATPSA